METVRFVSNVFTILGQDVVRRHTSDLIIDLPRAVESLEQGEVVTMLCRPTGADNIERYRDCLAEDGIRNASEEKCIELCEKYLGWTVSCKLHINEVVELTCNTKRVDDNSDFSRWDFQQLCNRFRNRGYIVVVN